MKSWKDVPNFFANGKFYVKSRIGDIELILGTELNLHDDGTWHYHIEGEVTMFPVEDAEALIARKIEDMTDEEKQELWNRTLGDWQDDYRFNKVDCEGLMSDYVDGFTYALEIGVLPPQFKHHFETGEVINNKTLKD